MLVSRIIHLELLLILRSTVGDNYICHSCLHLRWITRKHTFLAQYSSCWEMKKECTHFPPWVRAEKNASKLSLPSTQPA